METVSFSKLKSIILHKEVANFINYYIFTIFNAGISIFSISYLTKHLLPQDYGMIGIYGSILYFIPPMMSFSANGLQAIEIVDLDEKKYLEFRNNYISFVLLFSLFCFVAAAFFSYFIKEFGFVIIMATIMGFVQTLVSIHNTELIQYSQPTRFGLISTGTVILGFLLTVVFISIFKLDWKSRITALVISELFVLILRLYKFSSIGSTFKFNISQIPFRYFFKYGTPLMLVVILAWFQTQSDRYFLLNFFSLKEVGLYAAAAGIASFVAMINANMIKVVYPLVYKKLSLREGRKFIIQISCVYSILILLITIVLCIGLHFCGHLFLGGKFLSALPIIYIMCFTQAFIGVIMTTGLVIDYFKKTKLKTLLNVVNSSLVILLSFSFIPNIGIYAPAIASLISAIICSVLSFFIAKRIFITCKIGK